MRLGILDQSPVISGHTPARAVEETIMVITITGDYDSRLKSYGLLARPFGLGRGK